MGKKTDQWRAQRAAQAAAPDLLQLRPAGLQAVAPKPDPAEQMATRRRTGKLKTREQPEPAVPGHSMSAPGQPLKEGLGNYSPVAHVQAARQRFIQLYAERGTMVECCRLAGLSWNAVNHALEKDPEFKRAFDEAEQQVLEKLEREAMRRAVEGTVIRSRKFWRGELVGEDIRTEYSDNLLMMLLRAKAPERYRDNSLITINQVIKAVEGFDPSEVLGLGGPR